MARLPLALSLFAAALLAAPRLTVAQVRSHPLNVVPQARLAPWSHAQVEVTAVDAVVTIDDPVTTTTLDITLHNRTAARLGSQVLIPVPPRAAIRDFRYQGAARDGRAELLPAAEARRIYDDIVRRERDPALLEFIGQDLVRSSVFPVEPGAGQKIRLTYEHVLPEVAGRVDYVIPRTESLEYRVLWTLRVHLRARRPIATVYSPSHPFRTTRLGPGELAMELEAGAALLPGPVRLSYLRGGDGLAATSFIYPEGQRRGRILPPRGGPPAPDAGSRADLDVIPSWSWGPPAGGTRRVGRPRVPPARGALGGRAGPRTGRRRPRAHRDRRQRRARPARGTSSRGKDARARWSCAERSWCWWMECPYCS